MKKNLYFILFLIIAFVMLYISRIEYGSHSLDKSMKACIIAQKKLDKSKNIDDIKSFCEREINKKLKNNVRIKKEVIKYAKKLNTKNLSPLRSGNISIRGINEGVDGFFITPSGVKYDDLLQTI